MNFLYSRFFSRYKVSLYKMPRIDTKKVEKFEILVFVVYNTRTILEEFRGLEVSKMSRKTEEFQQCQVFLQFECAL